MTEHDIGGNNNAKRERSLLLAGDAALISQLGYTTQEVVISLPSTRKAFFLGDRTDGV